MVDEPEGTPGAHGGTEAIRRAARHEDLSDAEAGAVAPTPSRSRLTDIADQTVIRTGSDASNTACGPSGRDKGAHTSRGGEEPKGGTAASGATEPESVDAPAAVPDEEAAHVRAHRRRFLAQLGEFRRSRVLVPLGTLPGMNGEEAPLAVDMGGVRWILAFTGQAALARYALARGEAERAWRFRSVWGAALLDAAAPAVAESGWPCGVLVDAADGARGWVLPPVAGVVPENVAVDGPEPFVPRSSGIEEGA